MESSPEIKVCGFVKEGFETIKDIFIRNIDNNIDTGSQLCVYFKNEKIIDLWTETDDYNEKSIQNVFSTTKVISSLVIAMLVDRGFLDYETRISEFWPEFGLNGKKNITVSMLMRHEAGLSDFNELIDSEDLTTEAIKEGKVTKIVEKQIPSHTPGKSRTYHAFTRGIIENEIVRRVDPQKRTIGEFLKEEIAIPLGIEKELCIGIKENIYNISDTHVTDEWWTWWQLIKPSFLGGGKVPVKNFSIRILLSLFIPYSHFFGSYFTKPLEFISIQGESAYAKTAFNDNRIRKCEIPSVNGHASGRALGLIANTIVQGISQNKDTIILTKEGIKKAIDNPIFKIHIINTYFNNAGWNHYESGYIGWAGIGGSICQWNPELEIGFGYAMNQLEIPFHSRGSEFQDALYKCIQELKEK